MKLLADCFQRRVSCDADVYLKNVRQGSFQKAAACDMHPRRNESLNVWSLPKPPTFVDIATRVASAGQKRRCWRVRDFHQ